MENVSPARKRARLPERSPSAEHHPRVTGVAGAARSLIAFDIDKTVLHQGDGMEIERFRSGIASTLIRLARLGFNLAAVTGNDIREMSTRFLKALVEELCTQGCLELICSFHFFCNGAALYLHFSPKRRGCAALDSLLSRASVLDTESLRSEALRCLFDEKGEVLPVYISTSYAQQCCIPARDADLILKICHEEVSAWWGTVAPDGFISDAVAKEFYICTGDRTADEAIRQSMGLDKVNKEASVYMVLPGSRPVASMRTSQVADGQTFATSCNIKPVLSFRHAKERLLPHQEDPRIKMVKQLRARLAMADLSRYLVNPGGRGSIDITHHLVNKRSAITYLLRHLSCEGIEVLGEPQGVNCVFFGDEVVFNGNDLSVAEIPGILVFAVNELTERVPFHTNIELPSNETQENGPEATKTVLEHLVSFANADHERTTACPGRGGIATQSVGRSTVARWKAERLRRQLQRHCAQLTGDVQLGSGTKLTYQRLEASAATVCALLRKGEGLDRFAVNLMGAINDIGSVTNLVREQQFEANLRARGYHTRYIASPVSEQQD